MGIGRSGDVRIWVYRNDPYSRGEKLHEYCCTVYTCFRQYTNRVLAGILIDGS